MSKQEVLAYLNQIMKQIEILISKDVESKTHWLLFGLQNYVFELKKEVEKRND